MDFSRLIFALNVGAGIILLIRLHLTKLTATYRYLAAFVLFDVLYSVGLLTAVNLRSDIYAQAYVVGTTTELLLAVAVVMEVYAAALERHAALAKYGSRTVGYLLVAAGAIGALGLGMDAGVPSGQSVVLHRVFRIERTMDFGIVAFLALISIFIAWFPVRLSKNVVYYGVGFAMFYASRSAGLLVVNVLPHAWQARIDIVMLCISFISILFLAVRLRAESESPVPSGPDSTGTAAARLSSQLDAISALLSRLAKD